MRVPILSLFKKSPFENLKAHTDKVRECTWMFKRAIECYLEKECQEFEMLAKQVSRLENEADNIKRNIREHLPKGFIMPIDNFQLLIFLREQDRVLDAAEDALDWLDFRMTDIPERIGKDLLSLVDKTMEAIELLGPMMHKASSYFRYNDEKDREEVKELIREIRQKEHESDQFEKKLKRDIFNLKLDVLPVYHLINLVDIIGQIADHAENAGDMMRAMVAR